MINIPNFVKHHATDNKTVFVDESNKSMIVVYSRDIDMLNNVIVENSELISTNDRYTKYKGVLNLANCEYLVITNYTQHDYFIHTYIDRKMIEETPEYYQTVTLPNALKVDKGWIYKILDGVAEQERIIYQDDMFVLLKDIKWNDEVLHEIHLLALPKRRDLLSIRDIDASNIALIKHIDDVSRLVIGAKYGLKNERIRSYFHYYPSYWHLHVHFDLYGHSTSSDSVDFCRSLHDVVQNININPDYYKIITMNVIKDYFNE